MLESSSSPCSQAEAFPVLHCAEIGGSSHDPQSMTSGLNDSHRQFGVRRPFRLDKRQPAIRKLNVHFGDDSRFDHVGQRNLTQGVKFHMAGGGIAKEGPGGLWSRHSYHLRPVRCAIFLIHGNGPPIHLLSESSGPWA